jgi:starch synthase
MAEANFALQAIAVDLEMARDSAGADLLHSHTWYANLAGHLGGLLHGIPHVITAHSLEPRRPWKEEQLGGGYRISSWVERSAYAAADAIIAVSHGMRADVLDAYPFVDPNRVHVVHNGVDTDAYRPTEATDLLEPLGIRTDQPYVVFVGRITRQKGILHLIRAAHLFDGITLVLFASSPDTPEMGQEVAEAVADLRAARGPDSVVWIQENAPRPLILQALSHSLAFVCPSIYEPLGIVNLEAMACETAVVASAVGGIPEVVLDGETGILVPYDATEPRAFEHAFADAVNDLAAEPTRVRRMGEAGRLRAISDFGWDAIALRTIEVYRAALHR